MTAPEPDPAAAAPVDSTGVDPSAVDPGRFRLAMGRFATGVTVVTTRAGEHDHAMTANSLASVSLDPLLVLVCVENDSRFFDAVPDGEGGAWLVGSDVDGPTLRLQRTTSIWATVRCGAMTRAW